MPAAENEAANPPRPPVEGPAVWTGAEMREREAEWTYRLSPAEVAEIEAAVRAVRSRGLDIAEVRRADFPLPTFEPVLDRLRAEVVDGRGFVLLRGLPVEDRPIADSAMAYWGIGAHFGSARSQNAHGHLLGHVYDWGKGSARQTPICAAMRRRNGRISTSTVATSSRCCVCGARNREGCRRSSAR